MSIGQGSLFFCTADEEPLTARFVTGNGKEAIEWLDMAGARCGRQLDLHWLQFSVDDNQQIDFKTIVRSPEMQVRLAPQCHEHLDGFGDDPAFQQRPIHLSGQRSGGIRLARQQVNEGRVVEIEPGLVATRLP